VNDRARWIIVTAVVDVLLYPYLLPDRRRVYHDQAGVSPTGN
jgi:hypothetical protein